MGLYTDDDLDDLIKKNIKLTQENNRLLKKLHRAQVWGMVLRIVWLLVLFGLPLYFYFYYVKPYMDSLQDMYADMQGQVEELRALPDSMPELPSWMQGFFGGEEPVPDEASSPQSQEN